MHDVHIFAVRLHMICISDNFAYLLSLTKPVNL